MRYVIFTGGDFTPSTLSEKALKEADIVIAADSGANTAVKYDIYPSVILGDMDSISKQTKDILKTKKIVCITSPQEKDETDTELAIAYAIAHSATKITLLGGIAGNRLDHIVANLFLLTAYTIPIQCINGNQRMWVTKGPSKQVIFGKKGELLSLISLTQDVQNITTENLYYSLQNGTLVFDKPRGVSNVLTKNKASVSFSKGIVLFVHTIRDEEA